MVSHNNFFPGKDQQDGNNNNNNNFPQGKISEMTIIMVIYIIVITICIIFCPQGKISEMNAERTRTHQLI